MVLSREILVGMCGQAYSYFLETFSKYIDNPRKIKVELLNPDKFPSDPVKVPACTTTVDDGYVIKFNIALLLTTFKDYVKLICWHEVAHVVTDELYRCNKIKQSRDVNGGHPVLFFKVMDYMNKTPSEEKMQNLRHEIPYNKGMSLGFDEDYDPMDELLELEKRFSYRINRILS